MSAKQIKYFGTSAQKARLRNRRRATNSTKAVRKTVSRARTYHRPRKSSARKNPGDILSLVLNPGGRKGKNMAASRRRSRSSGRRSNYRRNRRNPVRTNHRRRRRNMKANPVRTNHRRRRRNNTRHNRRRNFRRNQGGASG